MGLFGSESKFIVPLARPSGAMLCIVMKLASDPKNPMILAALLLAACTSTPPHFAYSAPQQPEYGTSHISIVTRTATRWR